MARDDLVPRKDQSGFPFDKVKVEVCFPNDDSMVTEIGKENEKGESFGSV
ncbi:hypothetical protein BLA29_002604, partial [Euroglyphus maynei]